MLNHFWHLLHVQFSMLFQMVARILFSMVALFQRFLLGVEEHQPVNAIEKASMKSKTKATM